MTVTPKKAGAKTFWRTFGAIVLAAVVLYVLYTVSYNMRNSLATKVGAPTA